MEHPASKGIEGFNCKEEGEVETEEEEEGEEREEEGAGEEVEEMVGMEDEDGKLVMVSDAGISAFLNVSLTTSRKNIRKTLPLFFLFFLCVNLPVAPLFNCTALSAKYFSIGIGVT